MEFLKKNKKKILVLSIMVILLVATGVLNWALSTDAIGSTSTTTSTEPSTATKVLFPRTRHSSEPSVM